MGSESVRDAEPDEGKGEGWRNKEKKKGKEGGRISEKILICIQYIVKSKS